MCIYVRMTPVLSSHVIPAGLCLRLLLRHMYIRVYCRTLFPILPLYVYYSSVAFTPLTFLVGTHVPVRMNGTYVCSYI